MLKNMNTKLTLKLNNEVIQRAKAYAGSQHRSLSAIVEDYLTMLTAQTNTEKDVDEVEISPFVASMATGLRVPADVDAKAIYACCWS